MAGGAVTGALSMLFGATLRAPHGGIFVIPLIGNPLLYLIAIAAGTAVSAGLVILLKGTRKARPEQGGTAGPAAPGKRARRPRCRWPPDPAPAPGVNSCPGQGRPYTRPPLTGRRNRSRPGPSCTGPASRSRPTTAPIVTGPRLTGPRVTAPGLISPAREAPWLRALCVPSDTPRTCGGRPVSPCAPPPRDSSHCRPSAGTRARRA